MLKVQI